MLKEFELSDLVAEKENEKQKYELELQRKDDCINEIKEERRKQ